MKEDLTKSLKGITVAHKDAKEKGIVKGVGGSSSCPCPVCNKGTIKYSVASSNGHMHGRCTTEGCICWME